LTYLDDLADQIRQRVAAAALPDANTDSLFRLYAVLALAKGDAVTPADVHNAWAAWMQELDPRHGALVPFSALDAKTQQADEPFVQAIRAAAAGEAR
jgi:hypothetical protein